MSSVVVTALVVTAVLLWWGGTTGVRVQRVLAGPRVTPTPVVEIADVADLLALALLSGRGITDAMSEVSEHVGGRLGRDLAVVVAARRWGLDDRAAWRLVDPAWQPVARALMLAEAAGVPPSTTLTAAAADVRRAEDHRLDVAVERLGVRLVLPLGVAFLPAFVLTTVVPVVAAMTDTILAG